MNKVTKIKSSMSNIDDTGMSSDNLKEQKKTAKMYES